MKATSIDLRQRIKTARIEGNQIYGTNCCALSNVPWAHDGPWAVVRYVGVGHFEMPTVH